jgi:hypothetical protein
MLIRLDNDQLTDHFRLSEFVNTKDGNRMHINRDFFPFVEMLETFRRWYGRPMIITSGYRTARFNATLPGADANSLHLIGLAADFKLPMEYYIMTKARKNEFMNNIKNRWFMQCDQEGIPGSVVLYDTIFHLDYRTNKRYFDDRRTK